MKGVVFNLLEEAVIQKHGEDVWDALLDSAGLDGSYTSLGNYADDEMSRLVLAGVHRDLNTMRDYDIDEAIALVTLKLVGYTEVAHSLMDRLSDDSSILIFGGLAKERPYPGSMTVTTINHGVDGLVRSLTAELKPIRVNALHPGIVEDSPFWEGKTEALDAHRNRTTTGRLVQMQEVVDVAVLMLENPSIAGAEFRVDAGWSMPY